MRSIRVRTLGLALVAVFALGAVAVGSASAQITPGLGRCVKLTGGMYKDAGCTEKVSSGGKFEWKAGPGEKNKFKSSGEKATLEGAGEAHTKITCTSVSNSGEYTNGTEYKITVTFLGCESGGIKCENTATLGEIGTNPLRGKYGIIETLTKLGTSLEAFTAGTTIATFKCGSTVTKVTGSVISPITPVNKMELKETEKFAQTKGIQKPTKFEGQAADVLMSENSLGKEQAGEEVEAVITNEEELEIRGEA